VHSDPVAEPAAPVFFSVIRGRPSAEEVAALTVVLGSLQHAASTPAVLPPGTARGTPAGRTGRRSQWSARDRLMRPALHPGPGAWRASALP
jgi:Acyl-CoA carboxylase epsilon subunit